MKPSTLSLAALTLLFAAACVAAAVRGMDRETPRLDAAQAVRSYSEAIAGSLPVIARRRTWPAGGYEGLSLSVETRDANAGRIAYDVVAIVNDKGTCIGAIQGGRDLSEEVHVGEAVLTLAAILPHRSGRAVSDPTVDLCTGRVFPLTLRFRHVAEAPSTP